MNSFNNTDDTEDSGGTQARQAIGPDDPGRQLTIARPGTDETLPHYGVVGDNYTILIRGDQTDGKYALIDMLVPPGGGPPPHRHDFEEMFHVLEGELELTFRGRKHVLSAGEPSTCPPNPRTSSTIPQIGRRECSA